MMPCAPTSGFDLNETRKMLGPESGFIFTKVL
jgi:hypothetical protein